jgi:ribosomal protein S18 acetylase RimI-like enzyme
MAADALTIRPARTEADLDAARRLFTAYAESLDFDLCFQDFEAELDGLPGDYAPPGGALLLAEVDGTIAGCVALRPMSANVCEMKRLYVQPAFRCEGLGRALARAIVEKAQALGYNRMRLDTVRSMTAARHLYASLGFEETEPYYHNPLPDVVYMERDLRNEKTASQ